MKKTSKAKVATTKVLKKLAAMPKPIDISKPNSSRAQYSIKCKRKFAKYMVKHDLPIKLSAEMGNVSEAQAYAWRRDLKAGLFDLKHSVCVSRS